MLDHRALVREPNDMPIQSYAILQRIVACSGTIGKPGRTAQQLMPFATRACPLPHENVSRQAERSRLAGHPESDRQTLTASACMVQKNLPALRALAPDE